MRILITGAAGFLGSTLVQHLKVNNDVVVFDNLMYNQGPLVHDALSGTIFHKEDILDWSDTLKDEISRADIIIPLAAIVGAPACDKNPERATAINYGWIKELLNYVNKQTVLLPTTNSSYGTVAGICTEETPTNPLSLYAKDKQAAESILINSYNHSIVFRLATVFGYSPRPRLDLLINSLCMEALNTGKIVIFDGHFRRNYIHVEDIAQAFKFAIYNRFSMWGKVYNLGNDSINMTKAQLAGVIGDHLGVPVEEDSSRTDPDKRDYLVSSQKLLNAGFKAERDLIYGIDQMTVFNDFLTDRSAPYLRNY